MHQLFQSRRVGFALVGGTALVLLLLSVFVPNWSSFAGVDSTNASATSFWRANWRDEGEEIYRKNCQTCHGAQGEGIGTVFPQLRDNRLVTGPAAGAITLPLHGRGAMPGFSHLLTDEEIAAVVSYIRESWDNNAPPVSPAEVGRLRVAVFEAEDE